MIRSKAFIAYAALSALVLGGCGTTMPPGELVQARAAYKAAEAGPATRFKPAELHVAKTALDRAEAEFAANPGEHRAADLGYVAARKAEYAAAQGEAAQAVEQKSKAEQDISRVQSEQLEASSKRVKGLEGAVAQSNAEIEKQKQETAKEKNARLDAEKARVEAEKKAKDAMDALEKSLAVKNEERGTVITLSGSVLFATGQSVILPGAMSQLDKVADALKSQSERHFAVEGHTDNQGTDTVNQALSQKRAEAVRDYLIVHGVASGAISAVGKGSIQPVADNKTVEGRAMNRRVEIIVQKQ